MSSVLLREAPPMPPVAEDTRGGLPRVLGPLTLTGIGVGGIIGTGIFVMTGIAARDKAGPAVIVSFLVAALVCACAALCYPAAACHATWQTFNTLGPPGYPIGSPQVVAWVRR